MYHDPIRANIPLIPVPKKALVYDGEKIVAPLSISTKHEAWKKYINIFKDYFRKINEIEPTESCGGIELCYDITVKSPGYVFDSTEKIKISASDDEGILYGLATALQLLNVEDNKLTAAKIRIEDYPDKDYRGLMVDLANRWHPLRTIFRYIDACFYFKIKYLHLHFIDNRSYTLPSKAFPEISTKDRHYTFDEIVQIRKYAAERNITLIPELEAPGHARSLVNAYPEVFGNKMKENSSAVIITENGSVIDCGDLICAGNPAAMDAIKTLIAEISEMFPETPYIHIGGDEANIKAWNDCEHCVKYMHENGIEDEYELYSDFIGKVAQSVLDNGKIPIVWEGFPKKGSERVPKETIVIAWESHYHLVTDLLEAGFKIINCTWQPLYIVNSLNERWNPYDILAWNVYNWQHWWEESEATLNPIIVPATDQVLGAQIASWGLTYEQDINFVMENISALSERTWSVHRECSNQEFSKKLAPNLRKLAQIIIE